MSQNLTGGRAQAAIRNAVNSDYPSQAWLGVMPVLGHQYDPAIDQARLLLDLDPASFWGHFVIGVAYRQKGMFDVADDT